MPEMTFEEAILALEQIVRSLEGGNVPLEESLTQYEEAMKLVKLCSEKLSVAEQKIKILTGEETQGE